MSALLSSILPVSEAHGEGDRPKGGGGALGAGQPLHHGQVSSPRCLALSGGQGDLTISAGPPPHPLRGQGGYGALLLPLLLTACATQATTAIAPAAPGFLLGVWHGFIFPVAWILSLFLPDVAIYAVPNNGGWYDFGYFLGIVVFGVGARKSHVVYRDRVVRDERVVEGTHYIKREDEA